MALCLSKGVKWQRFKIKIETYGAIERLLPKDLNFSCVENSMVSEILQQISDQYPDCASLLEKCACAIG